MIPLDTISRNLGLHRAGRELRGTRPACGYVEALAITERDGRLLHVCHGGCGDDPGAGRARFKLICDAAGGADFKPAERREAPSDAVQRERKRKAALSLWNRATPAAGTLAETYLVSRGLPAPAAASRALRFMASHPHENSGRSWPIMLAAIVSGGGNLVAVHRTYLREDGAAKAPIDPTKMSLGALTGGPAIRLNEAAPEIVIAEGIETALAAGVLTALPAWAAISAGNMHHVMTLPDIVRAVTISVDPDPAGESAARAAATRWRADGKAVRFLTFPGGRDAADILKDRPNAG